MKLCGTCKALKVAGDFNRKTRSPDGLQPSCRACSKETSAAHYAAHPEKYLAANAERVKALRQEVGKIKTEVGCQDCSAKFPEEPWLLEFDHLGGEEKVGHIARLISNGSRKAVLQEIAKCEIVCVLCHRRRTAKRAGWCF